MSLLSVSCQRRLSICSVCLTIVLLICNAYENGKLTMQPDLNGLSLLVDIIEAGNLWAAQRQLARHEPQPVGWASASTTSMRQIGAELLRRSTRQLEPTELGWQLYEHARAICHEGGGAGVGRELCGKRLATAPSGSACRAAGQHTMSAWFIAFMNLYPAITPNVVFDNDIDDLIKGRGGLLRPRDGRRAHQRRGLQPWRRSAVLWPAPRRTWCAILRHAADLEQFKDLPLITSELTWTEATGRGAAEAGQPATRHPAPADVGELFFLRDAILQGLGVGLVPHHGGSGPRHRRRCCACRCRRRICPFLRTTMYRALRCRRATRRAPWPR